VVYLHQIHFQKFDHKLYITLATEGISVREPVFGFTTQARINIPASTRTGGMVNFGSEQKVYKAKASFTGQKSIR
jgi:hypothetical protein